MPQLAERPSPAALAAVFVALVFTQPEKVMAESVDVWLGTTTPRGGDSRGIYHARFDTDSGQFSEVRLAAEANSPGFLALHPTRDVLYATGNHDGAPSVSAYRISRGEQRSTLEFVGAQPIGDGGAAHLSTDRTGKVLLTAQYGGGSTALFPLAEDGRIEPRAQLAEHGSQGSGVVDGRQDVPHAHWTGTSPDNRFVFVPDLGLDKVVIWKLDLGAPRLSPHGDGECPPGSGPRHMKFHPDGDVIYVLNELSLAVTTFRYDAATGTMTPIQTVPTLCEEVKSEEMFNSASEIRVHPSGRFVYAANRGNDTITVLGVDPETKQLEVVETEPIRGAWPRNFNLDPTGKWLLAAGRDSHTVAVFSIDPDSGKLTYTREMIRVPSPICVLVDPAD